MTGEAWVALGGLVLTILVTTVTTTSMILTKINKNKEELDQELTAIRMSAFEEYKTLRREIAEVAMISRKEFGDTIYAMREKVTQVEIWIRDQLTETRHTLTGSMDMRHSMAMEKLEKTEERMRQLELFAAKGGFESE
jgi:predicted DNA-binding protein (UPF0251 family)